MVAKVFKILIRTAFLLYNMYIYLKFLRADSITNYGKTVDINFVKISKGVDNHVNNVTILQSRAEQSRAEQSRAEQSRAWADCGFFRMKLYMMMVSRRA